MLDRSLLCAPLLVPTFLSIVFWPKEPVGRSIHVAAPVEAAVPAGLATAGISAAGAAVPSAEPRAQVERSHAGCSERKADPAAATATI